MTDVFLDTVGLIATWDQRDQWHAAADTAYQILLQQNKRLVTTPLVLWECGNAAARCPYRSRVNVLRQFLIQDGALIEPTFQEIEDAWAAYDQAQRHRPGLSIMYRSR